MSDQSTQNVTLTATWVSSNTNVATIGASANPQPVTGVAAGTSNISAEFHGKSSNAATVTVGTVPLAITTTSCPMGVAVIAYTCQLTAGGGSPPYTWSISSGALPTWASLTGSNITGTPPTGTTGTTSFTVQVADSASHTATVALSIVVIAAGGVTDENYYSNVDGTCRNMGSTDGPAMLPQQCFNTASVNTPAPGGLYCVLPAAQALPASCTGAIARYATVTAAFAAIGNGAIPCGSTIKVVATNNGLPSGTQNIYNEAGTAGTLTYPAIACDAAHWIIVESDMINLLPPEGSRVSPAWVGIPSLPNRPNYSQPPTPGIYMPRIRPSTYQRNTLTFALINSTTGPVSAYARFIGLQLTQPGPTTPVCAGRNCQTAWQTAIVESNCMAAGVLCPDHIILDRMVVSGDDDSGNATFTVCTGLRWTGTFMAVISSYIYQVAGITSRCEPKTLGNGNTAAPTQGPYKSTNNFIEGGAENYFWGGGYSTSSAINVEFRRNHMWKPWKLWMPFAPNYLGTRMLVKNLGESKDLRQALYEGNIYEYAWYGPDATNTPTSDQAGGAVLLHTAPGTLPDPRKSEAADQTFRYNYVAHDVRPLQMDIADCASSRGTGCPAIPVPSNQPLVQRISVHDSVFDDTSTRWFTKPRRGQGGYDGSQIITFNQYTNIGSTNGTLNNLRVDHNTIITHSYSQDLTIASISKPAGTATLTAAGPPPAGATGIALSVGLRFQVFGTGCAGYDEYGRIATVISQNPATFTYTSTAPAGTCNAGFVSLIRPTSVGALNLAENAGDVPLVAMFETGTAAQALIAARWPAVANGPFKMCTPSGLAAAQPAGCNGTLVATFTIWGLTGTLACYNNKMSTTDCPPNGTPPTWSTLGFVVCTGVGTGNVWGNGDATNCRARNQVIISWEHTNSGLASANANASSYVSYWASYGRPNYGPNPNPGWQGIVITNNILGGRVQQVTGRCRSLNQEKSSSVNVLNNCGVVETSGPGAYQFNCNVVVSHPAISQVPTADTLPSGNSDSSDTTYATVGFRNFNWDGMGQGVSSLDDLRLAPTSPFINGVPGCGGDGSPPGANIDLVEMYTAGVE